MRARKQQHQDWEDNDYGYGNAQDDYDGYEEPYAYDDQAGYADEEYYPGSEEQGLILQRDQSLVGVSSTVTQHGVPLLSYTRTMSRFYNNRKQTLSLGRHKCEVCGERIRFWAYETPNGNRTHDGCYERLAWTWTNLYAYQQHLASEGNLE
jgi:hypothetical protein